MLGKPKPAVVHVDMAKRLKDLGLSEFFPDTLWPPTAAVRELASKLKALKKLGQENAFVSVDLKKCAVWFSEVLASCHVCAQRFLPPFCPEFKRVDLGDENDNAAPK